MNLTVDNLQNVLLELQETMRIPQAKNEKFAKGTKLTFDRFIEKAPKADRNNPDRMNFSSLFVYSVEDAGVTRKVAFTAKELNLIKPTKGSEMQNVFNRENETIVVPGEIIVDACDDRKSQGGHIVYPWNQYPDAERKVITEGNTFNADLWEQMLERHQEAITAKGVTPTQDMTADLRK